MIIGQIRRTRSEAEGKIVGDKQAGNMKRRGEPKEKQKRTTKEVQASRKKNQEK